MSANNRNKLVLRDDATRVGIYDIKDRIGTMIAEMNKYVASSRIECNHMYINKNVEFLSTGKLDENDKVILLWKNKDNKWNMSLKKTNEIKGEFLSKERLEYDITKEGKLKDDKIAYGWNSRPGDEENNYSNYLWFTADRVDIEEKHPQPAQVTTTAAPLSLPATIQSFQSPVIQNICDSTNDEIMNIADSQFYIILYVPYPCMCFNVDFPEYLRGSSNQQPCIANWGYNAFLQPNTI